MIQYYKNIHADPRAGQLVKDLVDLALSKGVTRWTHFQDIGPHGIAGMWGLRQYLYEPATPRYTVISQYNAGSLPVPEMQASFTTAGAYNVGASPTTTVKIVGGLGRPIVSYDVLPQGRSQRKRKMSGTLTAVENVTTTLTITDEAVPPNVKTLTLQQDVAAPPPGKRFWRLRAIGAVAGGTYAGGQSIPSLTSTDFVDGSGAIGTSGWVLSGDQYSTAETYYNLVDGNDATVWTGQFNKEGVVYFSLPAGNAMMPTRIRMRARADLPDRAPKNFVWEYSDDKATWTAVCTVTNAVYTDNVYIAVMDYSAGGGSGSGIPTPTPTPTPTPSPTPTPTPTPTGDAYRFFELTVYGTANHPTNEPIANGGANYPSLATWGMSTSGVPVDYSSATASGDEFSAGEGIAKVLDGDDATAWTGRNDRTNVELVDLGAGKGAKPDLMWFRERDGFGDRAPGDFMVRASKDGVTFVQIYRTTNYLTGSGPGNAVFGNSGNGYNGAYVNQVFAFNPIYPSS